MTLQKRSYTSGHFELVIDGHKSTAYLKTVDGGFVKASPVDEPVGPHNMRIKHTSIAEVEPITLDFGLSSANEILKWVQQSWRKEYGRRSGQITRSAVRLHQRAVEGINVAVQVPGLRDHERRAVIKLKRQPLPPCRRAGREEVSPLVVKPRLAGHAELCTVQLDRA